MRLTADVPAYGFGVAAMIPVGITGTATMMTVATAVPEKNERNTLCSPRSLCLHAAPRLHNPRYARSSTHAKCGRSENEQITRELG